MRKLLITLKIVQIVDNEYRKKIGLKRIGKGYFKAYRLNPLNPICYLIALFSFIIVLILYGFIGCYERFENPFKWN